MKIETLKVSSILTMPASTPPVEAAIAGREFAIEGGVGCTVVVLGSIPLCVILTSDDAERT